MEHAESWLAERGVEVLQVKTIAMTVDLQRYTVLHCSSDDRLEIEVDGRSVSDPTTGGMGQDPDCRVADSPQHSRRLLGSS